MILALDKAVWIYFQSRLIIQSISGSKYSERVGFNTGNLGYNLWLHRQKYDSVCVIVLTARRGRQMLNTALILAWVHKQC